jgi:hypothetical protein
MAAEQAGLGRAVVREERVLLGSLTAWAVLSIVVGLVAWRSGRDRSRTAAGTRSLAAAQLLSGVGRQAVLWGLVDGAVAGWGASRSAPAPADHAQARTRALRMTVLTGANALADVGYVVGGLHLMRSAPRRGDGLGVAVQGLFLLWLDVRHAARFSGLARPLPRSLARTDRSAPAAVRP